MLYTLVINLFYEIIPEIVGGLGDFLLFLDEEVFRAGGVEAAEVGVVLFEYSKKFPQKSVFFCLEMTKGRRGL